MIGAVQYMLGIFIALCFFIGLFPVAYYTVFVPLIIVIILQMIISFCRLRFLHTVMEGFVLFLALLSLIPFVGWFFRLFALALVVFDLTGYSHERVFKQHIEVRTYRNSVSGTSGESSKKKKKKVKAKDVKFTEK